MLGIRAERSGKGISLKNEINQTLSSCNKPIEGLCIPQQQYKYNSKADAGLTLKLWELVRL